MVRIGVEGGAKDGVQGGAKDGAKDGSLEMKLRIMYTGLIVYTYLLLLQDGLVSGSPGMGATSGTIGVVSIDRRSNVTPVDGFCIENTFVQSVSHLGLLGSRAHSHEKVCVCMQVNM